jgi:hypothetical protein
MVHLFASLKKERILGFRLHLLLLGVNKVDFIPQRPHLKQVARIVTL